MAADAREASLSDEIVLHHNPQSRAAIAHWMLEEVGAPYRLAHLDFQSGENRRPDFLAINPMGKIPTLEHRGVVVTETGAILAYLADAFPQAGLAPATDSPERGELVSLAVLRRRRVRARRHGRDDEARARVQDRSRVGDLR